MAKVILFARPIHECYKAARRWGGGVVFTKNKCPLCELHVERKAAFVAKSRARGHARRRAIVVEDIP